jgi:hypothetical protein
VAHRQIILMAQQRNKMATLKKRSENEKRRMTRIISQGFPMRKFIMMIDDNEEYKVISDLIAKYHRQSVVNMEDGVFLREYVRSRLTRD